MDHDDKYKVTVQGRDFILARSQVEFDSPNYFSMCFLGDLREAQTRHLKLCRDPDLFHIISDYLCGYSVLPLNEKVIPPRMSPHLALTNLRADAVFYQLDDLVKECDALISPRAYRKAWKERYAILGSSFTFDPSFNRDIDTRMVKATDNLVRTWCTYVKEERLKEEPLNMMERPESNRGFNGLRTIAAMERFADIKMEKLGYEGAWWKLVG